MGCGRQGAGPLEDGSKTGTWPGHQGPLLPWKVRNHYQASSSRAERKKGVGAHVGSVASVVSDSL